MIKLINKVTGTEMYVRDDRAAEYMAAGHKPAVVYVEPEIKIKGGKPQPKKTVKRK